MLAFSAFVFNTSEFIPVGLLSDIAGNFAVSEATAGMMISIYAWVVGLMSLPLMMAVARVDWRKIMLWLVGLFALFQFASAVAPTYWTLVMARVGVACCHSVFWGVVPPYAIASAPTGKDASALGIVVTGSAIAMIVGMPVGRVIGLWLSWRYTFAAVGIVSLLVFAGCLVTLPKVKPGGAFSLRSVPRMLTQRLVVRIYAFIFVIVTAYFMFYSYIEPFLLQVGNMPASEITVTLVVMGAAGAVAGWAFSKWYGRHPRWFFIGSAAMIAAYLCVAHWIAASVIAFMAVSFFASMASTGFNMASQDLLIKHGPQPSTITVATYSGIFNIGIGSGAFIGGLLTTHLGIGSLGYAALPLAAVAVALSVSLARMQSYYDKV